MGRKTFESIGRVLPNRKHIILTRDLDFKVNNENVEIIHDISEINKYIDSDEETFIIGGGIIYALTIKIVNKIYLTRINTEFNGDTYFPKINDNLWKIENTVHIDKDDINPYDYDFIDYVLK